jgi:hypothetical protein
MYRFARNSDWILWRSHREFHCQWNDGRHSMHCAEVMKCRHTTPIPMLQSGFELGALIPQIKYWSQQSGGILKTKSRKQIEITLTVLTRRYEQAAWNVDTVASLICTVLETKRGCLQSGANRQGQCEPPMLQGRGLVCYNTWARCSC